MRRPLRAVVRVLGMYSDEMFTTDGSKSLASVENEFCNWVGGETCSGVAPGALDSLAAFTPVFNKVPMRTPTERMSNTTVKDRNFWRLKEWKKLMRSDLLLRARHANSIILRDLPLEQ